MISVLVKIDNIVWPSSCLNQKYENHKAMIIKKLESESLEKNIKSSFKKELGIAPESWDYQEIKIIKVH